MNVECNSPGISVVWYLCRTQYQEWSANFVWLDGRGARVQKRTLLLRIVKDHVVACDYLKVTAYRVIN